jgi:muramidase (phage lysozyme)
VTIPRNRLILLAAVAGVSLAFAARNESAAYPGAMPAGESAPLDLLGMISDSFGLLGMVKISAMSTVDSAVMKNPNVRAMLAVIRRGEGTADQEGYRRMFGGSMFSSYLDHPRKSNCFTLKGGKRICSTAAGAYQFLTSSWDETKRAMRLIDFSPAAQDLAAVGRMAARGALADVLAGRLDLAMKKLSYEWASLPGSPYGQPVISAGTAQTVFLAAGGRIEGITSV